MNCPVCEAILGVDEKTRLTLKFYGMTCSKECARTLKLDERFVEFLKLVTEIDTKLYEIMRAMGT